MCNFRFIIWREPLFHQIVGGHFEFLTAILEKSCFFFQKFFQQAKIENATSITEKKGFDPHVSP